MEITLDKHNKTEASIKVRLKEDDYQPGVTQKIKEYSKKANIKGFRPGKVPVGLIQKMYGKSILADELNSLLSKKLNDYLRSTDLQFLGEPMPVEDGFQNIDLDTQKDFEFEYQVGFAEEFELKIDDKLKIDKYSINIDEKVINETVENLQRQFGELTNPDVAAAKDTLYGTMTNASGEINKEISIDLNETEKSAEKKLIGTKVGEEVELDPKNLYTNSHKLHHQLDMPHDDFENLKGKVTFKVQGINRQDSAPVDQALFDKTFGEGAVKSEAEFREKIKESVSTNFKNEEEQYFDYQLREMLVEKAKINLPDNFLKKWLLKTNDQITEAILQDEYKAYSAELKWSLIRSKIVKEQDLKAEAEEVVGEAKNLIRRQFGQAGLIGQMEDRLDQFAQNYLQAEKGENYMKVYNQVLNQKVFDYLKATITIKEKAVSLDEFRKL